MQGKCTKYRIYYYIILHSILTKYIKRISYKLIIIKLKFQCNAYFSHIQK